MKSTLWIVQYESKARHTFPVRDACLLNFAVAAPNEYEAKKIVEEEYELDGVVFVEAIPWTSKAIAGMTLLGIVKQKGKS